MTNQSQNITEDFLDQLLDIIQGQTQQKPKREIVDIHGLATVLDVEVNTLYKTWRQYPHFFPGNGRNGKGAKFDVEDVLSYLKGRDYTENQTDAISRSRYETLDRTGYEGYSRGVSASGRGKKLEAKRARRVAVPKKENQIRAEKGCYQMGERTMGKGFRGGCIPGASDPGADTLSILQNMR